MPSVKEIYVDRLSVHPSEDALLRSHDALSYARRPSSTNIHLTIPLQPTMTTTNHNDDQWRGYQQRLHGAWA